MPPRIHVACTLVALAGLTACKPPAAPSAPVVSPAVNVRLSPVTFSTASPAIRAPGVLARQTEAELSFPVGGMIASVKVRAGDRVTEGQELARLQADPLEAHVTQTTTVLEKARRDLARIERLQAERVATVESLQDARSQVEQAAAALRVAEFNRRHAVIVAPTAGVILRRLAEPDELAGAGRPVLSFASERDGWIAKASLAARDAARIEVGSAVTIDDPGLGPLRGTVRRIAEAAETSTRTVPIEVAIPTVPAGVRSGLVASLVLTPRPVAARPAIPVAALRDGSGGRAALFTVAPGTTIARRIVVDVAEIDGDQAYLRTPLPADTRVIVAGGQYVRDGATVNVAN